jgi:hypothetical protein
VTKTVGVFINLASVLTEVPLSENYLRGENLPFNNRVVCTAQGELNLTTFGAAVFLFPVATTFMNCNVYRRAGILDLNEEVIHFRR